MAQHGNRWLAPIAMAMLIAPASPAQTLNLGPVPAPRQNTSDALTAHFMGELEASQSERERTLVRLGARLARTGGPLNELASRTISRHLDVLRGSLRDADRIAQDASEDPLRRQRLRELLARVDRAIRSHPLDSIDDAQLPASAEAVLGTMADLARELEQGPMSTPPRLSGETALPDTRTLRESIGALREPFDESADRLLELLNLFESVRAVPSLESASERGLRALAGVVGFTQIEDDRFVPRSALQRLPQALEGCLFDETGPRSPTEALAMLEALARLGTLVERCASLEGDTARRIEPVLGGMLTGLTSPAEAQMLDLMFPPLERSVGLIARGAALPSVQAVSPQLQYAWRFLLPQEQAARIASIESIARITDDPGLIASPEVVSALVGHAEVVESLEALLGVDVLQDELDSAGVPGAFQALEALRADLRLMGDREGYRAAGGRVLPLVRLLARYRSLPGADRVLAGSGADPDWAERLRALITGELDRWRLRLAMERISANAGTPIEMTGEQLDARQTLETLRHTVLAASDIIELADGGFERLDALPEFETFHGGDTVGVRAGVEFEAVSSAIGAATDALARGDAQRASVVLGGVQDELIVVGVLAELSRRVTGGSDDRASVASMECALVLRRLSALGESADHIASLSLGGRYREAGLDRRAFRAWMTDQAERTIDTLDWLSASWQRRR